MFQKQKSGFAGKKTFFVFAGLILLGQILFAQSFGLITSNFNSINVGYSSKPTFTNMDNDVYIVELDENKQFTLASKAGEKR